MDRRNDLRDLAGWISPEEAEAARKRKAGENRRVALAVIVAGAVAGILWAATGSEVGFWLTWVVLGMFLGSLAVEK